MHTNLPTCAQTKVMSSTTNLQTLVAFSLCRQQAVHACSAVHQRRAQSVHFWADPANPATTRQWQSFYSRFGGSSPASSQIRKKCATPFLKLWIIFTNTICHNAHHHWEPLNDKEISVGFFSFTNSASFFNSAAKQLSSEVFVPSVPGQLGRCCICIFSTNQERAAPELHLIFVIVFVSIHLYLYL